MASSNVLILCDDCIGSSFLSKVYQYEKQSTLQKHKFQDLFEHLELIKELNLIYEYVEQHAETKTRVFNFTMDEAMVKLNCESVVSISGIKITKLNSRVVGSEDNAMHQVRFPNRFPSTIDSLIMKKLQRLSRPHGELKVFRWREYYESFIGGWETILNAFGVDGVFLLTFYSNGDW